MGTNDRIDTRIEIIASCKYFSRDVLLIEEFRSIKKRLFCEVQQQLGKAR
jgi:hypothetical protein